MKWRIYKEGIEEVNLKKLLKQNGVTKLPSGTQFKPNRISWSKDGGYAGQKTLDKVCSQLEDAGWKRGEWRTGGVPDGSAVTNSNAYTSPDGQIVMTYSEHFGATAHDNFYGFTFKLVGGVNESDDWFSKVDRRLINTIINKEDKHMKWYRLYKESENVEEVNPEAEEKAMEVLAKMEHGTPTDEEFYKTPCFKFLDVRYVERWVEFDTVEGLWSSKNCDTRLDDITDELQLAYMMVFHKDNLHMINIPTKWVWIFGENATWEDVCKARMEFTGLVPFGYGEEVKNEILQALRGNAITHKCLEAIIRSTKRGR